MKAVIVFNCEVIGLEDFDEDIYRVLIQASKKLSNQVRREPGCVCTAPEEDDVLRDVNGRIIGRVALVEPVAESDHEEGWDEVLRSMPEDDRRNFLDWWQSLHTNVVRAGAVNFQALVARAWRAACR